MLRTAGIKSSRVVDGANHRDLELLLREVPGIGEATSTYFMMLPGIPVVKADVMIRRYVGRALSTSFTTMTVAVEAVTAAATQRRVNLLDLEHPFGKSNAIGRSDETRCREVRSVASVDDGSAPARIVLTAICIGMVGADDRRLSF